MKKSFLKSLTLPGMLLTSSLLLTGCGYMVPPTADGSGNSAEKTIPVPDLVEGRPLNQLTPANPDAAFFALMENASYDTMELSDLGVKTLTVFTEDYKKHQTASGELSKEALHSLLPEVQGKLKPLLNKGTLQQFSQKWQNEANKETGPESNAFMLSTAGGTGNWENAANLPCPISNTPWKTNFSDPQLTAVPVTGQDYQAVAYVTTAHSLVPCADGKILRSDMQWQLTLGPSADGSRWEVYGWEHKPVGTPSYFNTNP